MNHNYVNTFGVKRNADLNFYVNVYNIQMSVFVKSENTKPMNSKISLSPHSQTHFSPLLHK